MSDEWMCVKSLEGDEVEQELQESAGSVSRKVSTAPCSNVQET